MKRPTPNSQRVNTAVRPERTVVQSRIRPGAGLEQRMLRGLGHACMADRVRGGGDEQRSALARDHSEPTRVGAADQKAWRGVRNAHHAPRAGDRFGTPCTASDLADTRGWPAESALADGLGRHLLERILERRARPSRHHQQGWQSPSAPHCRGRRLQQLPASTGGQFDPRYAARRRSGDSQGVGLHGPAPTAYALRAQDGSRQLQAANRHRRRPRTPRYHLGNPRRGRTVRLPASPPYGLILGHLDRDGGS